MAIPAFLGSTWKYSFIGGISDVQSLMDRFATDAVSMGWTGGGGGLYTSPTDGVGRFFSVTLTRVTQQKLQMDVRDQSSVVVSQRRINCPSTNAWAGRIFVGEYHAVIDCEMFSSAPEAVGGGILDLSPEAQNAHGKYVFGFGYRNSSDTAASNSCLFAAMVDNVTATLASRCIRYGNSGSGSNGPFRMTSDERIWRPQCLYVVPTGGGSALYAGRAYQCLVSYSDMQEGAIFTVPIDVGTTAKFMSILGWTAVSSQNQQVAFRCG